MTAATSPALSSPVTRIYACRGCGGQGCMNCDQGEIRFHSDAPVWVSETPCRTCECGGMIWDTHRDFICHDGISGGRLRYFECDRCDYRECKP